jgi:hypothetical protein
LEKAVSENIPAGNNTHVPILIAQLCILPRDCLIGESELTFKSRTTILTSLVSVRQNNTDVGISVTKITKKLLKTAGTKIIVRVACVHSDCRRLILTSSVTAHVQLTGQDLRDVSQ